MGVMVSGLAFMPPPLQHNHEELLRRAAKLRFVRNKLGNQVSVMSWDVGSDVTVLYSHGNAEDLAVVLPVLSKYCRELQVNFVAYDYSGYGLSGGDASEAACYSDIECVFEMLTTTMAVDPRRVILFGRSLGSGPTIHAATRYKNIGGVVLQSPFLSAIRTKLGDLATVPGLADLDVFVNVDKIAHITAPVFIIHGTRDGIVPWMHSKQLYDLLQVKYPPLWVSGADHNDLTLVSSSFVPRLRRFVHHIRSGMDVDDQWPNQENNDPLPNVAAPLRFAEVICCSDQVYS